MQRDIEYWEEFGGRWFDENGTEYTNMVYSAQSHAMRLHDDRIRKYMLISSGNFEVVPAREVVQFDPFGVMKNE